MEWDGERVPLNERHQHFCAVIHSGKGQRVHKNIRKLAALVRVGSHPDTLVRYHLYVGCYWKYPGNSHSGKWHAYYRTMMRLALTISSLGPLEMSSDRFHFAKAHYRVLSKAELHLIKVLFFKKNVNSNILNLSKYDSF